MAQQLIFNVKVGSKFAKCKLNTLKKFQRLLKLSPIANNSPNLVTLLSFEPTSFDSLQNEGKVHKLKSCKFKSFAAKAETFSRSESLTTKSFNFSEANHSAKRPQSAVQPIHTPLRITKGGKVFFVGDAIILCAYLPVALVPVL